MSYAIYDENVRALNRIINEAIEDKVSKHSIKPLIDLKEHFVKKRWNCIPRKYQEMAYKSIENARQKYPEFSIWGPRRHTKG